MVWKDDVNCSGAGLYRREEHDACGVGFVAQLGESPSHRIIEQALECLGNLTHRGAVDADGASGDGAGIMAQLPAAFFAREASRLNSNFNSDSKIAVGVFFLPQAEQERARIMSIAEEAARRHGLHLVGWRPVPLDEAALGRQARETQPSIWHLLVAPGNSKIDGRKSLSPPSSEFRASSFGSSEEREFEQHLYVARKEIERRLMDAGITDCYLPSFSSRNIVYKGLLSPSQLGVFYRDLADPQFVCSAALFHQRFSTNTSPSWSLAQPFRMVAHNGEINTLLGNRNWMRVREAVLDHPTWGEDVEWLKPVIQPGGSDSASFDNALELLSRSGRTVHHALLMMIPEAWESSVEIPSDVKAFYHYHSCLMEPWDGPAAMAFLDGNLVGAALDRNGLRPARYTITSDGLVVMGSEVGILNIEPERVMEKGRLGPGQIFLVDLAHQKIFKNDQVKRQVSHGRKYRKWITRNMVFLPRLKAGTTAVPGSEGRERGGNGPSSALAMRERGLFVATQRAAGYTEEDVELLIKPLAAEKREPVGSMGDDTPLAALSDRPRPIYHYFRQMFAQVTNPPIDPLRESLVISLNLYLGPRHSVLVETPDHARMIRLESPFLFNEELEDLKRVAADDFKAATISTLFEVSGGTRGNGDSARAGRGMLETLDRIVRNCSEAVERGSSILILSDRGVNAERAAVPMLLVVGAVVEGLTAAGVGNKADLVLETAEAWEAHHFACVVGYGAAAVNPYLALEIVSDLCRRQELGDISLADALSNFRSGIEAGLKKIMSKMGISTLASYLGGKFFEIIGLDREVVDRCFPDTRSLIGGRKFVDLARDVLDRHRAAFGTPAEKLDFAGLYRFRRGFERHAYSPDVIRYLQKAAKDGDAAAYHKFAREVDEREPLSLRDLLRFRPTSPISPIGIDQVEPVESILRRFSTQAMSLGSLSPETQRTLAVAMNRIGAKSNTGEGGEDPDVYVDLVNGESAAHKIKQVASARFGVTPEYLVRAEELEIKMAQGSKPGEGGQLPAHKVTPLIARVRRAVEGIALISPPPHHDIYSIEDLAQLIYDLREINPRARIGVKLVSQAGVGTVACGVAKANADVVLISGHDGGTGASPLSSIKNTASPWELGLAEAHQALLANGLRSRVRLRADGGMKTGQHVVMAAILGANEFGFGSAALVALACVMARQCHLNTCPVGVATQREDLRKRFPSDPERLIHYLQFVAEQVRTVLAELGCRSLDEVTGRTELLEPVGYKVPGREGQLDLAPLLVRPAVRGDSAARVEGSDCSGASEAPGQLAVGDRRYTIADRTRRGRPVDELTLKTCDDVKFALNLGVPIVREYAIRNTNRTIGARVSGEIALVHGNKGLEAPLGPSGQTQPYTAEFRFSGSAGQSFGAFLTGGLRMVLDGEANDYVGKGMGGGEIVIRPPKGSRFLSHENTILGNAVLYGATAGRLFAAGRAGERFCVRNSGATAVVEGTGDHACEYMTGGVAVILGETGRNFGAGMTNGVAFVYDPTAKLEHRYNPELVAIERIIEPEDSQFLRQLVFFQAEKTGSVRARQILENWSESVLYFWKVQPRSKPQGPAPRTRPLSTADTASAEPAAV
ncbi:MAG: glutamate synthase large subunit [Acidobacteria bacterium]|nr:MAG: glutamate synthase large subunit [Acidobacteriota bacterium]